MAPDLPVHQADGTHQQAHHHHISAEADRRYLLGAFGLLATFLLGEVIVALSTGSLALLSDAGHMLTDVGAIAAALWALRLAARPAGGQWTFGWKRAEILAALANGVTLVVLGALIGFEAVRRLIDPPPVQGWALVWVSLIAVPVNLLAAWLLARANRSSLNIEGAYQHVLTDLYGFIGTLIAGIVIVVSGVDQADPLASLVVVGLMLRAGWRLTREAGRVLLEAAPDQHDVALIRDHLLELEHVHEVHDLHVWIVTSNLPAISAHVVVEDTCFRDGHAPQLLDRLQDCLRGHFDVEHSTFQLEPRSHALHEPGTH